MGAHANFVIVADNHDRLIIKDIGPWNKHFTITNDAEWVVKQLAPQLNGRRLFYIDSENECDEIVVENGIFNGFAPGPREPKNATHHN